MESLASLIEQLIALLKSDADAANAFGALASAAAAFLSLFISVVALVVALATLYVQRRHNRLSFLPLPEVAVADYENSLRIKLRNNGAGPLIVNRLVITKWDQSKDAIIDWMPELPGGRHWTNFTHAVTDRPLQPGSELLLLELTQEDLEIGFGSLRDLVRRALKDLVVDVHYTDVYGTRFKKLTKPLTWFGRNVE
jgi:hypothetical protein